MEEKEECHQDPPRRKTPISKSKKAKKKKKKKKERNSTSPCRDKSLSDLVQGNWFGQQGESACTGSAPSPKGVEEKEAGHLELFQRREFVERQPDGGGHGGRWPTDVLELYVPKGFNQCGCLCCRRREPRRLLERSGLQPYFRRRLLRRSNGPAQRELFTLRTSIDLALKGKIAMALDVMMQRVKSSESILLGNHWQTSQRMEVFEPELQGIAGVQEVGLAQRDNYYESKIR